MQTFRSIIRALQGAIGGAASKIRPEPALLVAAYHRVNRLANRLQALWGHWQAGTLPPTAKSQAGLERAPRPRERFPETFGWLAAAAGYQAVGHAVQLEQLINRPDFVEFVTAVPRAVRLVRPLRHMLGINVVPAVIGATRYHRPPRPRRAPPEQPVPMAPFPSFTPPSFEYREGQAQPFRLPNHRHRND